MNKLLPILILISLFSLYGQSEVSFSIIPDEKYRIIERSDYRVRVNGEYKGHVYNENRGILDVNREENGAFSVKGTYYVFEELTKDGSHRASKVDEVNQTAYSLYSSGEMIIGKNNTYPLLRSFPNYGNESFHKGGKWLAFSEKVVLQNDTVTIFPVYCEYTYDGTGVYNGINVHNIRAKYAVRYNQGDDPEGNESLKNISGTHDVTIIIEIDTGRPILIRDYLKELHSFTNGGTLEKTGFTLTFFKGVVGMEKGQLAEHLLFDLEEDLLDDVEVSESDEGLILSLSKLHFVPDQAIILKEDERLLDSIAGALKKVNERTFFVKGHTADIGTVESQVSLSEQRAYVVVEELVKRGIREDRFLYAGLGGSAPIASNDTEEGRAQNRRVEIVILED